MTLRFTWAALLVGVALACSGRIEPNDAGLNVGAAGVAHSAGSSAAGVSGESGLPDDDTPGGAAGAAGEGNVAGDTSAGAGGVAPVHFWTEATQHIELECFGFFAGEALLRADRAELSVEQLELLASQTGIPGSMYDSSDDQIHCVVTTTDARERQRQFIIDRDSGLIKQEEILGEGGAAGDVVDYVQSLLGCEFQHPWPGEGHRPFAANPLCMREIWPDRGTTGFKLDLAIPGKPYHIELVGCTPAALEGTTVELFGADPEIPIATGVTPDDPGRDHACLVFDVQVAAPVVARLVLTSTMSLPEVGLLTFR